MTRLNLKSLLDRFIHILAQYQVFFLLGLGLVVGLLFVFLVPPWMHYDEPGHLEYAWLIANRPGFPEEDDYDQAMRRQISASIIEVDIEGYTGMTTDPMVIDRPIRIWITHIGNHPPTYYLLASLPLRLFRHSDIVFQLYLVRLVSLGMFLGVVWVAYRATRELFGKGHSLTWMVPLFLITLPAFIDVMTAANNDVAAVLAFSLFTWASVVLLRRGVTPWRVVALFGAMGLCLVTKNTAWLAVPLSLVVLLMATLRGKKWVWLALEVGLILAVVAVFSWQETAPAYFYGGNPVTTPDRVAHPWAPLGEAAIAQDSKRGDWIRFYHFLSVTDRADIAGKPATLGAWIWSDAPTTIRFPGIEEEQITLPPLAAAPIPTTERLPFPGMRERPNRPPTVIRFFDGEIALTRVPQFFAFSVEMPPLGGDINWIYFPPSTDEGNRVYWDGIVLITGDFADAGPPVFDDATAETGVWGGVRFTNLVRNASGEAGWPVFAGWVRRLLPARMNISFQKYLMILDAHATGLYFRLAGERIFRTFWSVFGWANVALFGQKPYRFFLVLSLVYTFGLIMGAVQRSFRLSWEVWLLFGLATLGQVIVVLYRGIGSWFSTTYIPVGRYLYPTILPLGILLVGGAEVWVRLVHRVTRARKAVLHSVYALLHMGILAWGIFSMWLFYYRL